MGDMLRARRRGVFRREYELSTDAGPVTSLAGGRRESCDFSLADKGYRIERVGRKQFRLLGPEGAVALAERQTGREWTIQTSAGNLTLAKPSIWRSHWEVLQGGTARGEIRHDGAFKRTYSASVPADVPPARRDLHVLRGPGDLRTPGERVGVGRRGRRFERLTRAGPTRGPTIKHFRTNQLPPPGSGPPPGEDRPPRNRPPA
jgi:hypothetical protein